MAQHFLLSAKARTLSLKTIFRMSDDEAHATFAATGLSFLCRCASPGRGGTPEQQMVALCAGRHPDDEMQRAFAADPRGWLVQLHETPAQRERLALLASRRNAKQAQAKG